MSLFEIELEASDGSKFKKKIVCETFEQAEDWGVRYAQKQGLAVLSTCFLYAVDEAILRVSHA
jgi:hypothetical protein